MRAPPRGRPTASRQCPMPSALFIPLGTASSYSRSYYACLIGFTAVGTAAYCYMPRLFRSPAVAAAAPAILTAVGCVEHSFCTATRFCHHRPSLLYPRATSGRAVGRGLCRSRSLQSSSQSKMRPARYAPLCADAPPLSCLTRGLRAGGFTARVHGFLGSRGASAAAQAVVAL